MSNVKNDTIKYRAYPNSSQIEYFRRNFGCCRFIWNKMLEDKMNYYEIHQEVLKTTPAQYKDEFPFLREVDSLGLANVQIHQQRAFESFFKGKTGKPNFKKKKFYRESYTTNNQKDNIRFEGSYLKLPKIGLVKIRKHREPKPNTVIKSITVSEFHEQFCISVLFEYEEEFTGTKPIESAIGLDFKPSGLFVDSEGNSAGMPNYYAKALNKIVREQQKLSNKEYGSNNYRKQQKKLARVSRKAGNQRTDFLHKQSCEITNRYDAVAVENISVMDMAHDESLDEQSKAMASNYRKSLTNSGWSEFVSMLEYKCKNKNKSFVKVDKFFPSSQLCHCCGEQNPAVKDLSVRSWICPACGANHDRDINAAINIRNEGVRLLKTR